MLRRHATAFRTATVQPLAGARFALRALAAATLVAAVVPTARAGAQQGPVTVTFNSFTGTTSDAGVRRIPNCYTEMGLTFSVPGFACGNPAPTDPGILATYTPSNGSYTGSPALFNNRSDVTESINITGTPGFSLFSLDLAPIILVPPGTPAFGSTLVTFTGMRLGGMGMATQTFNLALNATTLQRVTLNGFTNLASATILFDAPDFSAQIDNISANVVPEPSTYALMATGLAAVATMARRRRRSTTR